jgi:hypothetical protein
MGWALLEDPEFAAGLYRNETGRVRSLWDREGARRFGASRKRAPASLHKVPYAVNTCLAHGLWLAILRHTEESAGPSHGSFAISIATSAMTVFAPAENGVHVRRDHSSPFLFGESRVLWINAIITELMSISSVVNARWSFVPSDVNRLL